MWSYICHEKADGHGLQSVILQGLLFVDPEDGRYEIVQRHWGPVKFGNFQGQIDKIHYLRGKLLALKQVDHVRENGERPSRGPIP